MQVSPVTKKNESFVSIFVSLTQAHTFRGLVSKEFFTLYNFSTDEKQE